MGQTPDSMEPITIALIIIGSVVLIIGINAAMFLPLYFTYRKVPEQYQKMPAWSTLLLLVPCLNLILYWVLIPFQIPEAMKQWVGQTNPEAAAGGGDFGQGLGIAAAITMSMGIIPYVGACTGLAYLVLHIIYLVKLSEFVKLGATPQAGSMLAPGLDPNNPYGRA